ncbi:MAG: lipoate protein ligase C-terminal domain-containing protein [Candidatus Thermoplasmatota archaeon]
MHSVYKVPNGKLLKIFLTYNKNDNCIENIKITGDFFAYPEEAIELLEQALQKTFFTQDHVFNTIRSVVQKHNIQFIGLSADELTKGILMCAP